MVVGICFSWLVSGLGPTAELGGLWKPPNNPTTQGVAPLVNPATQSPLFWRVLGTFSEAVDKRINLLLPNKPARQKRIEP
jgi:hypothetical protein